MLTWQIKCPLYLWWESEPSSVSDQFQNHFLKVFMSTARSLFPWQHVSACFIHNYHSTSLLSAWHRIPEILPGRVKPLPTEHVLHPFYWSTNQTNAGAISCYFPSLKVRNWSLILDEGWQYLSEHTRCTLYTKYSTHSCFPWLRS